MQSTMMNTPLSINHLLERAGTLFPQSEIVSRLPDKSLKRHSYAQFYQRTRAFAAALQGLGPAQRRARGYAVLEPPCAPRVLLWHPCRAGCDAHAEFAALAR